MSRQLASVIRASRPVGLAVIHEMNHRTEWRGLCAACLGLDPAGRPAFLRKYSCKATALLCSVSCEL